MGKLGSDEVDELDRNMWAPEDEEQKACISFILYLVEIIYVFFVFFFRPKDEQELGEQESGGGTSLNEETKIVAKEGNL